MPKVSWSHGDCVVPGWSVLQSSSSGNHVAILVVGPVVMPARNYTGDDEGTAYPEVFSLERHVPSYARGGDRGFCQSIFSNNVGLRYA